RSQVLEDAQVQVAFAPEHQEIWISVTIEVTYILHRADRGLNHRLREGAISTPPHPSGTEDLVVRPQHREQDVEVAVSIEVSYPQIIHIRPGQDRRPRIQQPSARVAAVWMNREELRVLVIIRAQSQPRIAPITSTSSMPSSSRSPRAAGCMRQLG